MKTEDFNLLFLNIYDVLEITIENFYYRMFKEANRKMFEVGYNKGNEEGWVHCPTLKGKYCGFRNDSQSDELDIIKIHVTSFPFKMAKFNDGYLTYVSIDPEAITGITILQKQKSRVMDQICHALSVEKNTSKN